VLFDPRCPLILAPQLSYRCQRIRSYMEAGNTEFYRETSKPLSGLSCDSIQYVFLFYLNSFANGTTGEDDRKRRALDYVPPVVQDENTSLEDAAPTTSESAQSHVPFTSDSTQSFASHVVAGPGSAGGSSGVAVTGPPIIPQPQLNSQGPEFPSFNNGMYSFSGENSGTLPQLTLSPVLQTPTLPGGSFPSNSTLALPSPSLSPITSWNEGYWNSMPPLHMAPLNQSDVLPYNFNFYSPPSLDGAHGGQPHIVSNQPHVVQPHIVSNPINFPSTTALNPSYTDTSLQQPALHNVTAHTPQADNSALNPTTSAALEQPRQVQAGVDERVCATLASAALEQVQAGVDEVDERVCATSAGENRAKNSRVSKEKHPRRVAVQPSTELSTSDDTITAPLRKTTRVRQESTRMAQANMIGATMKRPHMGENESVPQKK
jgi:hypothetical protein